MKIAKGVNRLGTEAVYNIFAKTKELKIESLIIILKIRKLKVKHKK